MLARVFFPYRYLAFLMLVYGLVVVFTFRTLEVSAQIKTSSTYLRFALWGALIVTLFALLIQAFKLLLTRHQNPAQELVRISRLWLVQHDRGGHAIAGFLVFMSMLLVFSTVKSTLPQLVPFSYDALFHRIDQIVFQGTDPYQILMPIFGGDFSLLVLNTAYQLWLLMVVASILWILVTRDHSRRIRYLFASLLSFAIAGNLMAVLLSSAGPCYFEFLYGGKEYSPLFDHLREVNDRTGTVWALTGQEMLWESYNANRGLISGISAMPSMHNVFAWLWVFLLWRHRFIRVAVLAYALMIYIGSIVLGWHYAVDGIAGFFLAIAAWWLAGPLAKMSLRGVNESEQEINVPA